MCGLAGFISKKGGSAEALREQTSAMTSALVHRGPDDSGEWYDTSLGIALGFRRLSIVDLSEAGHQPMHSASGRYVIVLNGEIYNFPDLRAELAAKGHQFRGHSDTEVLLTSFDEWGLDAALQKLNGMFAFALWDRGEQRLHLVRDRVGEKPLYFGWLTDGVFAFASELKAIQKHPAFRSNIDRGAVALYLRHGYVPAPYSIFEGIRKVRPGTSITLDIRTGSIREETYWSLRSVVSKPRPQSAMSEEEAIEQLDALIADAVKRRMIADVPLGAFLSGGIDSSTVVAAMQRQTQSPVRTFTIGFSDHSYNEAPHAAEIARHLGTDHTEMYVTPQDAMAVIPGLPRIYDEPFADSSQIPTYLVARLARQHVTVALSGDGGDELFGGYSRYARAIKVWRSLSGTPRVLKRTASFLLGLVSPSALEDENPISRFVLSRGLTADRIAKARDMLRMESATPVCRDMVTHWRNAQGLAGVTAETPTIFSDADVGVGDFAEVSMYLDAVTYLPDDILVKLDRATMALSVEGRVPLLDHRIIEFVWQLPLAYKIRGDVGKWILRQVLYKHVPRELVERPKHGFGVPIDAWLRHDLRDWAESYLNERKLREDGIFEPASVLRKWKQHLTGACNWKPLLWDILMFQAWREEQRKPSARSEPIDRHALFAEVR